MKLNMETKLTPPLSMNKNTFKTIIHVIVAVMTVRVMMMMTAIFNM